MCILRCNGNCSRARNAAVIKITPHPSLPEKENNGKNCYLHNSESNASACIVSGISPLAELKSTERSYSCRAIFYTFVIFFSFCFSPCIFLSTGISVMLAFHVARCAYVESAEYLNILNRAKMWKHAFFFKHVIIILILARDICMRVYIQVTWKKISKYYAKYKIQRRTQLLSRSLY